MYDARLNVGVYDFAVTRAINELQQQRDYVTEHQIAQHIGCSVRSVNRAVCTLIQTGRVERVESHTHRGSRYIVHN